MSTQTYNQNVRSLYTGSAQCEGAGDTCRADEPSRKTPGLLSRFAGSLSGWVSYLFANKDMGAHLRLNGDGAATTLVNLPGGFYAAADGGRALAADLREQANRRRSLEDLCG